MRLTFSLPGFLAAPLLRLRSWFLARERELVIAQARAQALTDVDALPETELRASLAPGRRKRGWDGAQHHASVPAIHRAHYARAYYVASRDHARARLRVTGD